MRATVVVVTWNGRELLSPCLAALEQQTLPRDQWQCWVVDNASTDGSAELVAAQHPWVRVLRNEVNLGFAGGNNTALREVVTPFAVLLNNDAVPDPDWLERLLAPFDEPGADDLGAVTGKVVFLPRFAPVQLASEPFVPGPHDPRELGVRIGRVVVDGADVTEQVLWERAAYGPEGQGAGRFRWTRARGQLLVPAGESSEVVITCAAPVERELRLTWPGGTATEAVGTDATEVVLRGVSAGTDVVNNAGGVVFAAGYGADRGYQEPDEGQYDEPVEVFTACGNGVAIRSSVGHELGWFDDDFFLYYEDTDLSWRIRARGWRIRYEPTARVRHVHAASSVEWSPLFTFHVDRNRLLMLTKDATAGLAAREVVRYPLTTASMALRELRQAAREHRRPAARPTLLRLRVIASYLRLLPRVLARRRALDRTARVGRRELEQWLVAP